MGIRSQFDAADWQSLRLSMALVCRDATSNAESEPAPWANVINILRAIGERATGQEAEGDVALSVLAEFADEAASREIISRARTCIAELPESALQGMTEEAAAIVDRMAPEQSFRFRATLVLVAMLVSGVGTPAKF